MEEINPKAPRGSAGPAQRKGPEGLRSVERCVTIMFTLGMHPEGISLADLSRSTGITMTTVHRMLGVLRDRHLVRETPAGLQALGVGTLVLSGAFLEGLDVRSEAHPLLVKLRDVTNETCHLGTLASSQIVYIDKIDSKQTVRMMSRVGGTRPAIRTAIGKSILAFSSEEVLESVLADSQAQPHLAVDEVSLREELAEIRASGYSTDLEGGEAGICCVGAPVLDSSGRVVAGISVSTPSDRFDRSNVAALGELVRSTADQISEAAGYLTPNKMASLRQFVLDSARRPDASRN